MSVSKPEHTAFSALSFEGKTGESSAALKVVDEWMRVLQLRDRQTQESSAPLKVVDEWLMRFLQLRDVIQFSTICFHGIYLIKLPEVILMPLGAACLATACWFYPEQVKRASIQTLDSCKIAANYVYKNSVILAAYSARLLTDNGPNIWHYGVVLPASTVKYGVCSSTNGLKALAAKVGYCGTPQGTGQKT